MADSTKELLSPKPETLVRMTQREREEAQYYAQMGMPISADVVAAVKRVTEVRREMK